MMKDLNFINELPGLVIAKDCQSRYLNISPAFAKLLGWKSAHECQGVTDYEIPCKAVEFADEFIKLDKKVIDSKESMLALDIQNYSAGWKLVLVERNTLVLEIGTGLYNQCIDVSNTNLFRPYFILHQLDNKLYGKSHRPVSYVLNNNHSPLALTEKQENCLFLLIRGKSLKEIAKILEVSPRTIEDHIEAIKHKLNCQYKSELIEKAINSGFLYYVPEALQKNNLEQIVRV